MADEYICVQQTREFADTFYAHDPVARMICRALLDAAPRVEIATAPAEPRNDSGSGRWIPATERLPHKNMCVLACYTFDGYMQFVQVLDYYASDKKPHFQHEGDGMRVTHWMPLPELPEED